MYGGFVFVEVCQAGAETFANLWKCEQELVQMCVLEQKRKNRKTKAIGDK
jgi:hypothetical protein